MSQVLEFLHTTLLKVSLSGSDWRQSMVAARLCIPPAFSWLEGLWEGRGVCCRVWWPSVSQWKGYGVFRKLLCQPPPQALPSFLPTLLPLFSSTSLRGQLSQPRAFHRGSFLPHWLHVPSLPNLAQSSQGAQATM